MLKESIRTGRIVVIDDNRQYLQMVQDILHAQGYLNIQAFGDARAGLDYVLGSPCDLLVLDLHMPEVNGIDFLRLLQASPLAENLFPVLIMTGDDDPATRETALALGTMDYLIKPLRRNEVLLRVGNLLNMRLLHNQVRGNAAMLEERVQQRTKEVQIAHLDTVRRLAFAAEFRDDVTGRHIQRVGAMSAAIVRNMQDCPLDSESVRHAAQLHDIGKIGVPDSVLLKPGKLTSEEFETIKKHAIIGHHILSGSSSPLMNLAAEIAISHHERWDGRGYPNGLVGASIPLSGRVTAVADVFDALTHERPYKPAWSETEAVAEIAKNSGTMFDPDVVDAFTRIVGKGSNELLKDMPLSGTYGDPTT